MQGMEGLNWTLHDSSVCGINEVHSWTVQVCKGNFWSSNQVIFHNAGRCFFRSQWLTVKKLSALTNQQIHPESVVAEEYYAGIIH